MTKLQLAKRIANIVVYGHITLFIFGLVIMIISPYDRLDTLQMILMGSPLLASVGLSAYIFVSRIAGPDTTAVQDSSWVTMSTVTTMIFILALFATYAAAAFNTTLPASTLKIMTGAIETVLGVYLGVNRDTLFPEKAPPPAG